MGVTTKKKIKFFSLKPFFRYYPILCIVGLWFFFSHQYFLKNKVPFASTYQVNNFAPWSAYSRFWGPVKNGAMPDVITQIYPWKYFTIQTWKSGQIPLWNPYNFSGTPHLANYQSAVLSPFNLLFFLLPFVDAWSFLVLLQPLLAGVFTYLFLQSLNISKPGSLLSGISFMFCGFLTSWMGYGTLGYAILFLPLALFFIESYFLKRKLRYLILFSFTFPLSFFSGHFQISFYFLLFICSYTVFRIYLKKNLKDGLAITFFFLFGMLLIMPQLLPSMELYDQSVRSNIFQKSEVIPWGYIPTILAPDFFGNPVTRNDWFGHYAEWNSYAGLIPFILAIYALFFIKILQVRFFSIVGCLVLLLAFDTPLQTLLVNLHIPVLSTSAASRIIVLLSFTFAVLSGFGFDKMMNDLREKKNKNVAIIIGVFATIFVILWGIILLRLFIPIDKISVARSNLILPSLLFIGFVFFVLLTFLRSKKTVILVSVGLLMLVSFDMLRFVAKWQAFDPKELVFPEVPVAKYFSKISGFERTLGNLGGEASLYYKLPILEGYDPLYIKRYGEFISSINDGRIKDPERSVVRFPKKALYTEKAINLLGIKYIIHKKADGRAVWTFPFWEYKEGTFHPISNEDQYEIYENKNVFPRAFFVNEYKIIKNSQKIIDELFSTSFDSKKTAILEEETDGKLEINESGTKQVFITEYRPTSIHLKTTSDSNSLLVLTDIFYPGWKAFVDGKETKIYRTDYTLRSIYVGKGEHRIEFQYAPESFKYGMYSAFVGLLGILFVGFLIRVKKI